MKYGDFSMKKADTLFMSVVKQTPCTILCDFYFRCEICVTKGENKEPIRIKGCAPALNVFHLSNDSQRRWAYYTWIFISEYIRGYQKLENTL